MPKDTSDNNDNKDGDEEGQSRSKKEMAIEDGNSSLDEEEADRDFTILDEDETSNEEDYVRGETSEEEELDEEEIRKLKEEGVDLENLSSYPSSLNGNIFVKDIIQKCPYPKEECINLPKDWRPVTHASGLTLYLHKPTGVITPSRPYLLGPGSLKKHKLQLDSLPCLAYKKYLEKESGQSEGIITKPLEETVRETDDIKDDQLIPAKETVRENDAIRDDEPTRVQENDAVQDDQPTPAAEPQVDTTNPNRQIEASQNFCPIEHKYLVAYCKKLFTFKQINIRKFQSWKMKRAYVHKQKCKNKRVRDGSKSPNQTIVITVPVYDSDKKTMTTHEWMLNPAGKSSVCILHEYLQRAVKMKPTYKYKELEHALTPYQATITLNDMIYGSGIGSSKKQAKLEAAKATLEILIPQLRSFWPKKDTKNTRFATDFDKYSLFDKIPITDPRVAEFCTESTEPSPYAMLVSCLELNFGMNTSMINCSITPLDNEILFKMEVGKHSASVTCKTKKEGKQLASQLILQDLHPQVHYWGSLLRLYGNVINGVRKKKAQEEDPMEVESKKRCKSPNWEILEDLRAAMKPIYGDREYLLVKGKSVCPENIKDLFPGRDSLANSCRVGNPMDEDQDDADEVRNEANPTDVNLQNISDSNNLAQTAVEKTG